MRQRRPFPWPGRAPLLTLKLPCIPGHGNRLQSGKRGQTSRRDPGKPTTLQWATLQAQFGPDYDRPRDFRRKFVHVLREVQLAYPTARLDVTDVGLVLRNSSPPVTKRLMQLGKGMVIDVTPTPSDPVE
jgi:hypothetical protein